MSPSSSPTAPGSPFDAEPPTRQTGGWGSSWANGTVVGVSLLGLAAALFPLVFLHASLIDYGYDGAVYVGASVQLANGVIPYRDFVLLHPPGISLILLPIALFTRLIGVRAVFGACNLITICAVAANCGMVARLLRPRSRLAALAGGVTLAFFPGLYLDDHTTKLEPFMLGAILLGLILLYPDARRPQRRRALAAGIMLGFAIAIKLWAIAPVLVVLAVVAWATRDVFARFVRGLLIGVGVPLAPFVFVAPRQFFHDVITTQMARGLGQIESVGVEKRLAYLAQYSLGAFPHVEVAATALVVVVAGTFVAMRRWVTPFDGTVIMALLVAIGVLLPPVEFYSYYSYFPEVFLALTVGSASALVVEGLFRSRTSVRSRAWWGYRWLAAAGALFVVTAVLARGADTLDRQTVPAEAVSAPVEAIQLAIPAGSCVVTNDPFLVMIANRFLSNERDCPVIIDPYGTWLAAAPEYPPPNPPSFVPGLVTQWRTWFSVSQYVIITHSNQNFIPWTPTLRNWFSANFRLCRAVGNVDVYQRVAGS